MAAPSFLVSPHQRILYPVCTIREPLLEVDVLTASTFMRTFAVSLVLLTSKPRKVMLGDGMPDYISPQNPRCVFIIRLFLNWDFCEATCFYHANLA